MFEILLWLGLGLALASQCFIIGPAYTGRLVLNLWTKKMRPIGEGLEPIWPLLEVIVDDSYTDIVTLQHPFEITLEVGKKNKQPVPLKFSFTTIPHIPYLIQFRRFKKDERIKGIIENLKSFLTGIQEEYEGRDDLMDKIRENPGDATFVSVEKRAREFIDTKVVAINNGKNMTMQEYYGVLIPVFLVSDVEMPKDLQDAVVKNEIIEQENLGKTKIMNNVRERAKKIVDDAAKRGHKIELGDALEFVQVQDKTIKSEKHVFGLDSGTRGPVLDIIKALVKKGGA
ncbi:MAG: hypothetical protein Q8R26_03255 [bacterium]|nr:hypothetical protein [bacterium]